MKEDYEIKFWRDWLEGDHLKRLHLVEKLPVVKEIFKLSKIPKKHREDFFATYLNSFFEDLESAMYIKIRIEHKKTRLRKIK